MKTIFTCEWRLLCNELLHFSTSIEKVDTEINHFNLVWKTIKSKDASYPNETLPWWSMRVPIRVEEPACTAKDHGHQEKNSNDWRNAWTFVIFGFICEKNKCTSFTKCPKWMEKSGGPTTTSSTRVDWRVFRIVRVDVRIIRFERRLSCSWN